MNDPIRSLANALEHRVCNTDKHRGRSDTKGGAVDKRRRIHTLQLFKEFTKDGTTSGTHRLTSDRIMKASDGDVRRMQTDLHRNSRFFQQVQLVQCAPSDMTSLRCHHNSIMRKTGALARIRSVPDQHDSETRAWLEPDQSATELRRLQNVMRPCSRGDAMQHKDSTDTWWFRDASLEQLKGLEMSYSSDEEAADIADKCNLIPVKDFLIWIARNCSGSLRKAFEYMDVGRTGVLSKADFRYALSHGGFVGNEDSIFDILDENGTGAITTRAFQNLTPHFEKMLRALKRAKRTLGRNVMRDVADRMPVGGVHKPQPMVIRPACRIWLFRNADPLHRGEKLLLRHAPKDMSRLHELCHKVCSSRPGKVVGLFNAELKRVRSPHELVQNGVYVIHGGEPLEPPDAFWDEVERAKSSTNEICFPQK